MKAGLEVRRVCLGLVLAVLSAAAVRTAAGADRTANCRKVVFEGEVSAGQEWKAAFGEGWVFRVIPIQPGETGYSGWDLVVDREQPIGFPDALLLATPPYNSINEREVGTTFGLRSQDAIGWSNRSFHFLIDPDALRESQKLFQVLSGAKHGMEAPESSSQEGKAIQRQLKINQKSAAGQFRILDARLVPGVADPAPFAQHWALAFIRTKHTLEPAPAKKSTPLGELLWMRFSITLWLPGAWRGLAGVDAARVACVQ